jgi:hypothetical protein
VTGGQRDELVEARADFILAGAPTAKAFAEHFEAQMHRGKMRKLLAALCVLRSKGVILLVVILAPCALLGYATFTAGPVPVMLSGANGVAAVNTASGRLAAVTPPPAPPGAVSVADSSVWVAHPGVGQVWRIDPGTSAEAARVPVGDKPGTTAGGGSRMWAGIRRTALTTGGDTGVKSLRQGCQPGRSPTPRPRPSAGGPARTCPPPARRAGLR